MLFRETFSYLEAACKYKRVLSENDANPRAREAVVSLKAAM